MIIIGMLISEKSSILMPHNINLDDQNSELLGCHAHIFIATANKEEMIFHKDIRCSLFWEDHKTHDCAGKVPSWHVHGKAGKEEEYMHVFYNDDSEGYMRCYMVVYGMHCHSGSLYEFFADNCPEYKSHHHPKQHGCHHSNGEYYCVKRYYDGAL